MEAVMLVIIAVILMFIGLAGIFLPFLASTPIAWLGLFVYAYGTDFQEVSLNAMLGYLFMSLF